MFTYFCGFCKKCHHYRLDFYQSIPMDGTVWVKAIAEGCPDCHFIYKIFLVREYEEASKKAGVLPQTEVF